MSRVQPVTIPPVTDVEDLRIHIVKQLNDVTRNLAKSSKRTESMSLGQNRITDLADPSDGADAVNLKTLQRELEALRSQLQPNAAKTFAPIVQGQGTVVIGSFSGRPASADPGTFFIATDRGYETYVYNGGWQQISQETDASFTPSGDAGASLGSTADRFANAFIKSGFNLGGASAPRYLAEILSTAVTGQLHISDHDSDDGCWIMGVHNNALFLSAGAYYNGTNWVAKETSAIVITLSAGGGILISGNSGLVVGNTFTPTSLIQTNSAGSITLVNAITASGTVQAPTVNATTAFQANGTPGTTGTCTITAGHTITFKEGLVTSFT